ncbi:hypothetical protein [Streptomyces cyaneofuscatus]|uniref:hypothetical protein n=1 Tax=Streptomyces cyaneofuscatus TaxID=66883 RepID=UPI003318B23D
MSGARRAGAGVAAGAPSSAAGAGASCRNGMTAAWPGVEPTSLSLRLPAMRRACSGAGSYRSAASRQPFAYARNSRRSSSERNRTATPAGEWRSR